MKLYGVQIVISFNKIIIMNVIVLLLKNKNNNVNVIKDYKVNVKFVSYVFVDYII